MNSSSPFDRLSVLERLDLIGVIWDSISDSSEVPDIPDWHRDELDRRIAAADAQPNAGIPWEDAIARLRKNS